LIFSVLVAAKDATLSGTCAVAVAEAQKIAVLRKWTAIPKPIDERTQLIVIGEDPNYGKMLASSLPTLGIGAFFTGPKIGRMIMEQADEHNCRVTTKGKPADEMLKGLQKATEPVAIPKADSHANPEPSLVAGSSGNESASNSHSSIGAFSDDDPTIRHDGVQLTRVTPGGPADSAGIQVGDVILAVDNHYIYTANELTHAIQALRPGSHVAIRYMRRATIVDTSLAVERAP
jgi:hypothetical protein